MKRLLLVLCAGLTLSGCFRDSQNVFQNVSVHADRFAVERRIWLHNLITGAEWIEVEGYCAFWPYPDHINVACRIGDEYTQETIGLTPYIRYRVEQIDPIPVETGRRECGILDARCD